MGRPVGNSETKYTTWWSGYPDFVSAGSNVRFGSKADMGGAQGHSALHPKADMCGVQAHVRFTPEATSNATYGNVR
jgi:hypothetical protein